jgi:hypothetical protein
MLLGLNHTKRSIEQELEIVAAALRPGLLTAIWNINYKQVNDIVEGAAV